MTLSQALSLLHARYTNIVGEQTALSSTQEMYVELAADANVMFDDLCVEIVAGTVDHFTGERIEHESRRIRTTDKTEIESAMVDVWLGMIRRGVAGEGANLHWRVKPELEWGDVAADSPGSGTTARLYSRLLITDGCA